MRTTAPLDHTPFRGAVLLALGLLVALPAVGQVDPSGTAPSPYAGEETRGVKALSASEVEGLLAGEGMGLAKAAELNRYPGPRHVLDLAAELELTAEQRREVQRAFDVMHSRAVELGRSIVEAETELDRAFAGGTLDADELEERVSEIARLRGELRATHLRAHLETREVLEAGQVARYDALRGYAHSGHGEHGGHGQHHHPLPDDG